MPWEAPLQSILQSVEGPVAKIVAVIIIIVTGLTLAFGDTGGGFRRLVAGDEPMTTAHVAENHRVFRRPASLSLTALLISTVLISGCAKKAVPAFGYDADVPALPAAQTVATETTPKSLHTPPGWTVARGGAAADTAPARVGNANAAARVEPRREGYYNAIQIYPFSEGALYQVYAAPGQITDIALEPGENLTGAGPIAAGDTARWIIGDTESGSGAAARVHILVKPTRPDIATNLVVTTDRRLYLIELRAQEALYMPAVAWSYPAQPGGRRQAGPPRR